MKEPPFPIRGPIGGDRACLNGLVVNLTMKGLVDIQFFLMIV